MAVICSVSLSATLAVAGATVTRATATAITDTVMLPVIPSLVADTTTGRDNAFVTTLAVTTPSALTLATDVSDVFHVTVRPLSGSPRAFWTDAVNVIVARLRSSVAADVTTTRATGSGAGGLGATADPEHATSTRYRHRDGLKR